MRRDARETLISLSASCSESGEGPGTGGRGEAGGRDGGGFPGPYGTPSLLEEGMWVGGAGKEERRRGTGVFVERCFGDERPGDDIRLFKASSTVRTRGKEGLSRRSALTSGRDGIGLRATLCARPRTRRRQMQSYRPSRRTDCFSIPARRRGLRATRPTLRECCGLSVRRRVWRWQHVN